MFIQSFSVPERATEHTYTQKQQEKETIIYETRANECIIKWSFKKTEMAEYEYQNTTRKEEEKKITRTSNDIEHSCLLARLSFCLLII